MLGNGDENKGAYCYPNLSFYRISRFTPKAFNSQMLLYPLEECFDFPAVDV